MLTVLYTYFCAIILCIMFQIGFLLKALKIKKTLRIVFTYS